MSDSRTTSQKVEDMIDYASPIIDRWPKLYRYTLGERILNKMYDISELCTAAELKYYKKTTMQEIDIAKNQLQKLIRRASRTKYTTRDGKERMVLSAQHYGVWSEKLVEIGKLLGGWMKAIADRK